MQALASPPFQNAAPTVTQRTQPRTTAAYKPVGSANTVEEAEDTAR